MIKVPTPLDRRVIPIMYQFAQERREELKQELVEKIDEMDGIPKDSAVNPDEWVRRSDIINLISDKLTQV